MFKLYRSNQILRLFFQFFKKKDVAVIGGYHGVNLGDMILGYSVLDILKERGIKGSLQTIYTLDKYPWPKFQYAIIGGGAIGYKESIIKVVNRYQGNFDKVALLGVDFNEQIYGEPFISLMQNCAWISCRNKNQATSIETLLRDKNILNHPDLAFSYRNEFCQLQRKNNKEKILLVNIIPLYGMFINQKFVPDKSFIRERPELYSNFNFMIINYINSIRQIINNAISEGYNVETIPFTPGDESMAKYYLKDLNIIHNRYSDNPYTMLNKIAAAEKVYATRYHATIFAFKSGAIVIPMAYAKKNEFLLTELGFNIDEFNTSADFANGKMINCNFLKIKNEIIYEWEVDAHKYINKCIESLIIN